MNNLEKFTEQEIPYEILEQFGLTEEMIDDLPLIVKNRLMSGKNTPVLPIITVNEIGNKVQTSAKLSLIRKKDGTIDVMFVPMWDSYDLDDFEEEARQIVLAGNVTTSNVKGKGQCYIQFDDIINQVMFVPVGIINKNISILSNLYSWQELDDIAIQNGEITSVEVNGVTYSVGIDLNEDSGIRIVKGTAENWREEVKSERIPSYNFGINGCWIYDDRNHLKYVPDGEYDEKILDAQKRAAKRNVEAAVATNSSQLHL